MRRDVGDAVPYAGARSVEGRHRGRGEDMGNARTTRTGTAAALRRTLACLLAAALVFSLCGLPAAYGAAPDAGGGTALPDGVGVPARVAGAAPQGAPIAPQAGEETDPGDFTYDIRSGGDPDAQYGAGAYITDYEGASDAVVVPATLEGEPVVYAYLSGYGRSSSPLVSLNVTACTDLKFLDCSDNSLPSLDVSKNAALVRLDCSDNSLSSLDVGKNTAVTFLKCPYNSLSSLDVSENAALTSLFCYGNALSSLDVGKNAALIDLDCSDNSLSSLDVSENAALTSLSCSDNSLSSLDVSENTVLTWLLCGGNSLSSLDVGTNTALTSLWCSGNSLSSLDVSKNVKIYFLDCSGNKLTALDVSKNTALNTLYCYGNSLSSLDVSSNSALVDLRCHHNRIPDTAVRRALVTRFGEAWILPQDESASTFFSVSFNSQSDVAVEGRSVSAGSPVGALPAPVRLGHTFGGWFTEPSGGTRVTGATVVTANVTYYAHWTLNTYTVTFKDWDGAALGASQKISHGSSATAPAAPPRTGHTFAGWDRAFSSVTSDLIVTARYAQNRYTVTFKGWNGTVIAMWTGIAHGMGATAPAAPLRTGHTFAGWDKAFANVTSDLTVTAQYKANAYTVKLSANGGRVSGKASASMKKEYGQTLGPLVKPMRTGYTFQGWFTGKAKGTKVTARTRVSKNVTYYAHWRAKTYTVKLNANGGKVGGKASASVKRAYNSKLGKLATPKRTGYKFLGWYTGKVKGKKVTAGTKVTKAVTLYAHWRRAR
jgi:uncharacterized repeat protein (TIGR02543 family)